MDSPLRNSITLLQLLPCFEQGTALSLSSILPCSSHHPEEEPLPYHKYGSHSLFRGWFFIKLWIYMYSLLHRFHAWPLAISNLLIILVNSLLFSMSSTL